MFDYETQKPDLSDITFDELYDTYHSSEQPFDHSFDGQSEPFYDAFKDFLENIRQQKIQELFKFEHGKNHSSMYTRITEGGYFIELHVQWNRDKFYKAELQAKSASFGVDEETGLPVVLGKGKTRRPSKILPFIFGIFGMIKEHETANRNKEE